MDEFAYLEATELSQACDALASYGDGAKIIAGGQVLVTMLRNRFVSPKLVVSVRSLETGRGIGLENGDLVIGAMTTHREVERDPLIARHAPVLGEMERGLASPQVRNAGTIGGNLCHADPAEDPAPVLLVLGASAQIVSSRSERSIPLEELFVDYLTTSLKPDELLLSVRFPTPEPRFGAAYLKHTTRNAVDFPVAGVAAGVRLADDGRTVAEARIAFSALDDTPLLCAAAAEALAGRAVDEESLASAAEAARDSVTPSDDLYGSADYKRHLCSVLTGRAVAAAHERALEAE